MAETYPYKVEASEFPAPEVCHGTALLRSTVLSAWITAEPAEGCDHSILPAPNAIRRRSAAAAVQYAKSGRATCTGPCKRLIAKGDLRLGSPMMFGEGLSYKWRHW